MARLRWPVVRSDMKIALSMYTLAARRSGRTWPAVRLMRSAKSLPWIRSAVAIAPALTSGLNGRFDCFVEHDRVERLAGRLDADLLEHRLAAVVFERQPEHERLRDRLDAEQLLVVADVERLPVDGHDRDAEPIGVGQGQLGDVVGDLAVVDTSRYLACSSLSVARNGATADFKLADQIVQRTGWMIVGHRMVCECESVAGRASRHDSLGDLLQPQRHRVVGKAIHENAAAGQAHDFVVHRQASQRLRPDTASSTRSRSCTASMPGGTLLTTISISGISSRRASSAVTAVP